MWIDSHCHLNHPKIVPAGDIDSIISRARLAGVSGMLTICCRITDELPQLVDIVENRPNVWCTIGTHPHDAGRESEKSVTLDELVRLSRSHPKIIGIGESGLDYHYNFSSPEDQQESFRKHVRACIETGLPLVVHAREADADIMNIIREEGAGTSLAGVMHSFSSGRQMAEEALDFGFYLSFSGMATFANADSLREIIGFTPVDKILVETDAPYLAPVPHRGKINEPSYVVHTGACIAKIKNLSEEQLATITTKNFFSLFKMAVMDA